MEYNFIIFISCIIPSIFFVIYIYFKDKIEKEPVFLLLKLFLLGMLSAIVTYIISNLFSNFFIFLKIPYNKMSILQIFIKYFVFIACLEEFIKWICCYFFSWNNKNFNYLFDGIVYMVSISMGFAAIENIVYAYNYSSLGFYPIIIRTFISVPSHMFFAILMGYYYGISKKAFYNINNKGKKKYLFLSIFIPILVHFVYNVLLLNAFSFKYLFLIYILFLLSLSIYFINKINLTKKTLYKK